MKFSNYQIAPEIKQNLARIGYKKPTDIQYKTIPVILKGEDLLAIAQTGTGKTAAFAIPIIHIIHQSKRSTRSVGIKCLVMVPTHELAIQITDVFKDLAQGTRVKPMCLIGGVAQAPQIAQLNKGVDVLITTPGRMFDLIHQGHLKVGEVEILVLDEADFMLDLGFNKDIQDVIRKLPHRNQTLYFSATIDEKIKKQAYSIVKKPIRIQISPKNPVNKNIDHAVAFVEMDDKRFFLERFINEHSDKKMLVFVRTKVRAERVAKAMARVNIVTATIHSDKGQQARFKVMQQFRSGKVKVLVATDVSARGIDIEQVDYVINYDLPENPEQYVHRIGRTGRGRNRGNALSFCCEKEKKYLEAIHEYIGEKIDVLEVDQVEYKTTIDFSLDSNKDWQSLMNMANKEEEEYRQKKKIKKKK